MGKVLQFIPRSALGGFMPVQEVSEAEMRAKYPAPTPLLELGPGGSLAGATQPEVVAAALATNPMRRVIEKRCQGCGHEWITPSMEGRCPKCHDSRHEVLDERPCMAQRLK
jgi:hypothetical protein